MPKMKVRVKKSYPCLETIFKEGDILTLDPVLYEKDTLIVNEIWRQLNVKTMTPEQLKENPKGLYKLSDAVYAKAGSYKDCKIITKGRKTYLTNILGTRPLEHFFEKI